MKQMFILFFIFFTHLTSKAQTIVKYFDFAWKETSYANASFMAEIEKTDSGFRRLDYFMPSRTLQMKGLYKDSACEISNGYFFYFFATAQMSRKGKYTNDKMQGLWVSYHQNGLVSDSSFYENDERINVAKGWYENGVLQDSNIYEIGGMRKIYYWFDNANKYYIGNKLKEKKMGTWQYFHKNGNIAAIEKYNLDTLKSREYFDEKGILQKDTANKDAEASFKKGLDGWRKFIIKNLKTPSSTEVSNKKMITVVVTFTIDEEGNVTNPFVDLPYLKIFDKAALDLIKKSPKWNPAIDHNRSIKSSFRQPITYALE